MKQFNQLRAFVSGKKTYIIGTLGVLITLAHYLSGDISLSTFLSSPDIYVLLNSAGLVTLRASVSKVASQIQAVPIDKTLPIV